MDIEQQEKRSGVVVRCSNLSVCVDSLDGGGNTNTAAPTVISSLRSVLTGIRSKKPSMTKHILKNISVAFAPGTMTLILGQPGSGKSTLLKILASRFPASKTSRIEGLVTYNGVDRSTMLKQIPSHVAYVAQDDTHFSSMPVSETLAFASQCCGNEAGAQKRSSAFLIDPVSGQEDRHNTVIHSLGLDDCQNTRVGSVMMRGVSGGERRRVSLGEMLFGDKALLLFDEITTGLDSATAFDIVSSQQEEAQKTTKTVVMSLLQPSPEIFGLFDNVIVLNAGELLYFGPCCEAAHYFARIGYECPPNRNVADFLVDLGSDKQNQYVNSLSNGDEPPPRTALEFAWAFSNMTHDIVIDEDILLLEETSILLTRPEFAQSFRASTWTLIKRQFKLTLCNSEYIFWRMVAALVVGLLYGTIFYQFDPTDTAVIGGAVLTTLLFLGVRQAIDNYVLMEAREIFYKQRGANFYRTSSYLLVYALCNAPLAVFETAICGSIIYWACGFVSSTVSFLLFELLLFMSGQCCTAWFYLIAASSPNIQIANSVGMLTMFLYVLSAGAAITKDSMSSYLMWLYWVNPMAWSFRSIMVLQHRNESLDVCVYNGIDYCIAYGKTMGEFYLGAYGIPSEEYWIWFGLMYLLLSYVAFMVMATWAFEHYRFESSAIAYSRPEFERNHDQDINSYMEVSTPNAAEVELMIPEEGGYYRQHQIIKSNPVTLAFTNIWYSVPDPKNRHENIDLLKGVSGYAMPCTITALMGASGAGKTTLMDVLAGRKTSGAMEGQVLLNGYPATDLAIRRSTGYCEQMDMHSETATFREALLFSAFLRQGSDVSDGVKRGWVNECIELLELLPIADHIIRGSSRERLKRLTIGVELAARPSLLFLDEPTSGLDARAAKHIMEGLRKVADTGLTVVCTIHQPSSEVFRVFDKLLFLKRGGEMVFFGDLKDRAHEMIEYFESFDEVPRFEQGSNPAAWMLDVIGAGINDGAERKCDSLKRDESYSDFAAMFTESELNQRLISTLSQEGVSTPCLSVQAIEFSSKRAAGQLVQMRLLLTRFFYMHWRSPVYSLTRCFVGLLAAIPFALMFAETSYDSLQGVSSGIGVLYIATIFNGVISFDSALPFLFEDRRAFYRERSAQTYSAFWYFFASTVVEIPFVVFSSLLFTASYFPIVGFSGVKQFLILWLANVLLVFVQTYFGMIFAAAFATLDTATTVGTLLTSIFTVHVGFNPPASTLPTGYNYIYHFTPQKYILAIMAATIFADCPSEDSTRDKFGCAVLENAPPTLPENITVKEFVEDVFWMKYDEVWTNVGIVLIIIVVFRVLALVALQYCNHRIQ